MAAQHVQLCDLVMHDRHIIGRMMSTFKQVC